jgi:hypothetical protein
MTALPLAAGTLRGTGRSLLIRRASKSPGFRGDLDEPWHFSDNGQEIVEEPSGSAEIVRKREESRHPAFSPTSRVASVPEAGGRWPKK